MDGAILPIAVGVNPTLTISCLAERCMRLLAEREGWHIDYDTFKPLGKLVHSGWISFLRRLQNIIKSFLVYFGDNSSRTPVGST